MCMPVHGFFLPKHRCMARLAGLQSCVCCSEASRSKLLATNQAKRSGLHVDLSKLRTGASASAASHSQQHGASADLPARHNGKPPASPKQAVDQSSATKPAARAAAPAGAAAAAMAGAGRAAAAVAAGRDASRLSKLPTSADEDGCVRILDM